jgi:hypothetical protein
VGRLGIAPFSRQGTSVLWGEYSTLAGEKGTTYHHTLVNPVAFVVILTPSSTQSKIDVTMEGQQYRINRIIAYSI